METLTAAALQFSVVEGDVEANVRKVNFLGEPLKSSDPKVVVLPEMWAYGFDYQKLSEATSHASYVLDWMTRWSNVWNAVVVGSIAQTSEKGIVNRAYVIDPKFGIVGSYDKVHLFSPHGEHLHFARGSSALVAQTFMCRIGVVICYDIRFPEICRPTALQGAEILCIPALWPQLRVSHWRTLLRARAIENQLFVVGCNGCGKIGSMTYPGASAIVDPWGEVLAEGDNQEQVVMASVNLKTIGEVRSKIPCFTDRVDSVI